MATPGTELGQIERVASMPMATAQCRRFLNEKLPVAEVLATNSTADAARLVGRTRPGHVGPPHRGDRPAAGRDPLWARCPGGGRGGPPGQPDPVRVPRPDGNPLPHRSRPDQHCLLPERRPPRKPPRHPRTVLRPQHQPVQTGVETHQAGPRATTASSSTSRATSPMPWSATVSVTFTPAWPMSSSSGPIRRPVRQPTSSVVRRRLRGRRPTHGSMPFGRRSGRTTARRARPASRAVALSRHWDPCRLPLQALGGMAERTNARLLKSREVQASVGSNPTPSAGKWHLLRLDEAAESLSVASCRRLPGRCGVVAVPESGF